MNGGFQIDSFWGAEDPFRLFQPARYYPEEPLDLRISESAMVLFDEGLHSHAIRSLSSVMNNYVSRQPAQSDELLPVQFPEAQHLSFLSTLAIHPSFTTAVGENQSSSSTVLVAVDSLRLFSDAGRAGGPKIVQPAMRFLNGAARNGVERADDGAGRRRSRRTNGQGRSLAGMDHSFESYGDEPAPAAPRGGRGRARTKPAADERNGDDNGLETRIRSELANQQGVWAAADDFWHLLGWALSCAGAAAEVGRAREEGEGGDVVAEVVEDAPVLSRRQVEMAARWRWWRPWLEAMLDVVERDWAETKREAAAATAAAGGGEPDPSVYLDSLAVEWVIRTAARGGTRRRITEALFAFGSEIGPAEFRPVWPTEVGEGLEEEGEEGEAVVPSALNPADCDYGAAVRARVAILLFDISVHVPGDSFISPLEVSECVIEGLGSRVLGRAFPVVFHALLDNGPAATVEGERSVLPRVLAITTSVCLLIPCVPSLPASLRPFMTLDFLHAAQLESQVRADAVAHLLTLGGDSTSGIEDRVSVVLAQLFMILFSGGRSGGDGAAGGAVEREGWALPLDESEVGRLRKNTLYGIRVRRDTAVANVRDSHLALVNPPDRARAGRRRRQQQQQQQYLTAASLPIDISSDGEAGPDEDETEEEAEAGGGRRVQQVLAEAGIALDWDALGLGRPPARTGGAGAGAGTGTGRLRHAVGVLARLLESDSNLRWALKLAFQQPAAAAA